jgi:hypothetical protein
MATTTGGAASTGWNNRGVIVVSTCLELEVPKLPETIIYSKLIIMKILKCVWCRTYGEFLQG